MDKGFPPPVAQLVASGLERRRRAGPGAVVPMVYGELSRIAHRPMSLDRPGNSLQPTALVKEVYLGLVATTGVSFPDRSQIFALAEQMMGSTLVDDSNRRADERSHLRRTSSPHRARTVNCGTG